MIKETTNFCDKITDKIYEIMQLKDRKTYKYTLTFNNNSHHEGLSYHLFIPVVSTKTSIYNFIKLFNHRTDYKYVNMIDYRVYGKNRLFYLGKMLFDLDLLRRYSRKAPGYNDAIFYKKERYFSRNR